MAACRGLQIAAAGSSYVNYRRWGGQRWSCPPVNRWTSTWSIVGAGPAGLADRDPPQAARRRAGRRGLGRRGREGLRGRRPHPLRRGDRPDRPRPAAAGMARGPGPAAQDRGHRGRVPVSSDRPAALRLPNHVHAEAHGQPRQFRRLARQRLPLSRPQGRGARRRDLSGLPGRRGADRRQGRGRRRRHRRHGHRPATASRRPSFTRGMELRGQVHDLRRGRARHR